MKKILFQTFFNTQNRFGSNTSGAYAQVFIYNNSGSGYFWAGCQLSLLDGWAKCRHPFPEAHRTTSTAAGLSVWRIKRRISKLIGESARWSVQSQNGNGWFPWNSGSKAGERAADSLQRSLGRDCQQHHPPQQPGWHRASIKSSCRQLDYHRHLVLTIFYFKILENSINDFTQDFEIQKKNFPKIFILSQYF